MEIRRVTGGLEALELGELIGSPLIAIVEAEARAARATLDFITGVGFVDSETTGVGGGPEATADAGRLRMARFRYVKLDESNQPQEFTAEVPVLSLVPIPALQVREATIELRARVTEVTRSSSEPAPTSLLARGGILDRLRLRQSKVVARPAAAPSSTKSESESTHHLDIRVVLAQADLPLGLEKLFQVMDTAVREQRSEEGPT